MIYKTVTIACDHIAQIPGVPPMIRRCREEMTVEDPNMAEALRAAKNQGWLVRKGPNHYCPAHAFEHRQEPAR